VCNEVTFELLKFSFHYSLGEKGLHSDVNQEGEVEAESLAKEENGHYLNENSMEFNEKEKKEVRRTLIPFCSLIFPLMWVLVYRPMTPSMEAKPHRQQLSPTASEDDRQR